MKKYTLIVGVLILFLGASIFAVNFKITDIKKVLNKFQYHELLPPSNIFQPGTVIYIKGKDSGIICLPESSLGSGIISKLSESTTVNVLEDLGHDFNIDLDAHYDELIAGSINVKGIKVRSLSMQNSKVKILPDDLYIANKKNRATECESAIKARVKRGFAVETIESVLISEVKYSVNYETGASIGASIENEIIKNLSASFGAGFKFVGNYTIVGDSLIWGYTTKAIAGILPPEHRVNKALGDNNNEELDKFDQYTVDPLKFVKKPDVQ